LIILLEKTEIRKKAWRKTSLIYIRERKLGLMFSYKRAQKKKKGGERGKRENLNRGRSIEGLELKKKKAKVKADINNYC
jgi:hypothetical protein